MSISGRDVAVVNEYLGTAPTDPFRLSGYMPPAAHTLVLLRQLDMHTCGYSRGRLRRFELYTGWKGKRDKGSEAGQFGSARDSGNRPSLSRVSPHLRIKHNTTVLGKTADRSKSYLRMMGDKSEPGTHYTLTLDGQISPTFTSHLSRKTKLIKQCVAMFVRLKCCLQPLSRDRIRYFQRHGRRRTCLHHTSLGKRKGVGGPRCKPVRFKTAAPWYSGSGSRPFRTLYTPHAYPSCQMDCSEDGGAERS